MKDSLPLEPERQMMESQSPINDGGPAFPNLSKWSDDRMGYTHEGMSLRDYFATHAGNSEIAEMLARVPMVGKVIVEGSRKRITQAMPDNARQIARYMHADAMLKARSAS